MNEKTPILRTCENCGYSYRDDEDRVICPWLMNRCRNGADTCSAWVKKEEAKE